MLAGCTPKRRYWMAEDEKDRPKTDKKKKSKPDGDSGPVLKINRLKSEYLKPFTEICYSEGVKYEIRAHIYENEHEFYNILAKNSERAFLEWVAYLFKTKVCPDTMDFTIGG
jgi:hypothetical protein